MIEVYLLHSSLEYQPYKNTRTNKHNRIFVTERE